MIERPSSTFEFVCDFCSGGHFDSGDYEFIEAVETAKKYGWAVFKEKGEWHHKCPDCRKPEGVSEFN